MPADELASRRILVVEDSPVLAEVVSEMLRELGCVVVGPAGTMAVALELAGNERIDAAVIDLNIRGGKVYPVARELNVRGIPFLVVSGYGDWTMPAEWRGRPRLVKPFTSEALAAELRALLASRVAS
jgi:DNA-binding response OmpR family regulator